MNFPSVQKNWLYSLFITGVLIGLYFTTHLNYLLFHTLAEFFTIVIAFSFFTIVWNSKHYIENNYILFIGIAYLFIAFLDLLHTISYKGMPIFTDYDYYANQLWIGARLMESLTLLAAFYYLDVKKSFKANNIFIFYTIITFLLILSIFSWKIFPECFKEGVGLTPFKKISEYIICLILAGSIYLLYHKQNSFKPRIYKILLSSMGCTIISELAFTSYISNYGISNIVGHYFKLFSFYFIYKAIIETGIRHPYDLIFKELHSTNEKLRTEIEARIQSEKEREKLFGELQTAFSQVKTLSGLLPICSHCKKIRDDQGYWNNLETYIHKHSDVILSHSICNDCAKKHYPGYDIYDE